MKKLFAALITTVMLSSCVQTFYLRKAQSHFTYPNSNVTPIGDIKGQTGTKFGFLFPPSVTSELEEEAYQDALRKSSDADLIINADVYWTVINVLGYFHFGKMRVEGQGAKMEVGKQKLD